MSDIFLKNLEKKGGNVSDFLDTENVSSSSLPQWLSVVDVPQKGGNDDNLTDTAELEAKLKSSNIQPFIQYKTPAENILNSRAEFVNKIKITL